MKKKKRSNITESRFMIYYRRSTKMCTRPKANENMKLPAFCAGMNYHHVCLTTQHRKPMANPVELITWFLFLHARHKWRLKTIINLGIGKFHNLQNSETPVYRLVLGEFILKRTCSIEFLFIQDKTYLQNKFSLIYLILNKQHFAYSEIYANKGTSFNGISIHFKS